MLNAFNHSLLTTDMDEEDLVLDARAALSPAEMVDEKFFGLLGATDSDSSCASRRSRTSSKSFRNLPARSAAAYDQMG